MALLEEFNKVAAVPGVALEAPLLADKGTARARLANVVGTRAMGVVCVTATAVIALLVGALVVQGSEKALDWGFLTGAPQQFLEGGGIGPELFNSFYLLVITMLISVPLALGAAVFLTQYAPQGRVASAAKTAIETLSSLPSVVVGLFGMTVFVIGAGWGFSILSGACALTLFNLPILVRTIQQALESVPRSQRDAALALGLTRWEATWILSGACALTLFNLPILVRTIQQALESVPRSQRDAALALGLTRWEATWRVLLPSATPAIVTGVILSAGRVFGEAAALIYTAGQTAPVLDFSCLDLSSPTCPWNVFRPAETLAVHIWKINSEGVVPDLAAVSAGTAAVLLASLLVFNLLARFAGKLLEKRMTSS